MSDLVLAHDPDDSSVTVLFFGVGGPADILGLDGLASRNAYLLGGSLGSVATPRA